LASSNAAEPSASAAQVPSATVESDRAKADTLDSKTLCAASYESSNAPKALTDRAASFVPQCRNIGAKAKANAKPRVKVLRGATSAWLGYDTWTVGRRCEAFLRKQ
jgi:hypothetical protein